MLSRKHVYDMRMQEMEFLGMSKKRMNYDDPSMDMFPTRTMEKTMKDRIETRTDHHQKYLDDKILIQEEIDELEGEDIKEKMRQDRKAWLLEKLKVNFKGNIKDKKFNEQYFEDNYYAKEPTEEERLAMELDEPPTAKKDAKGKKGKKDKKAEKGKKKGKGKKDDVDVNKVKIDRPTEVIAKFNE
jgi:hypothetical protein